MSCSRCGQDVAVWLLSDFGVKRALVSVLTGHSQLTALDLDLDVVRSRGQAHPTTLQPRLILETTTCGLYE